MDEQTEAENSGVKAELFGTDLRKPEAVRVSTTTGPDSEPSVLLMGCRLESNL